MEISEQAFTELVDLINVLIKKVNDQNDEIKNLKILVESPYFVIDDSVSLQFKETIENGKTLFSNENRFNFPPSIMSIINEL